MAQSALSQQIKLSSLCAISRLSLLQEKTSGLLLISQRRFPWRRSHVIPAAQTGFMAVIYPQRGFSFITTITTITRTTHPATASPSRPPEEIPPPEWVLDNTWVTAYTREHHSRHPQMKEKKKKKQKNTSFRRYFF